MKNQLEQIGLTDNEAEVYLALLKLGFGCAADIIEETGMHRTSVYGALSRLKVKGLVSHVIVDRKPFFKASDPERLKTVLEEKLKLVDDVLPKLRAVSEKSAAGHEVSYFRGIEGIKSLFEDIIHTRADYVGYGAGEQTDKILKYYFKHFVEKKEKQGIHSRLVYVEGSKHIVPCSTSRIRFLPKERASPTSVRIYRDKVAIMLLSIDEPFVVIIKNRYVADDFRKRFEYMWSIAKERKNVKKPR